MPQYIHHGPPVFLNADKSAIVPGDSPRAAWLLVGTGGALSLEEAAQWGLGALAAAPEEPEDPEALTTTSDAPDEPDSDDSEAKARRAPANKKKVGHTEDK